MRQLAAPLLVAGLLCVVVRSTHNAPASAAAPPEPATEPATQPAPTVTAEEAGRRAKEIIRLVRCAPEKYPEIRDLLDKLRRDEPYVHWDAQGTYEQLEAQSEKIPKLKGLLLATIEGAEDPERREIRSEIRLYHMILDSGKTPEGGKSWPKRGSKLLPHLPALLSSTSLPDRYEALVILRDQLDEPGLAPAVCDLLGEMLAKVAEDEAPARLAACQVLGKYPDLRSAPVLVFALGDKYMRRTKPTASGEKEQNVAVWWEADDALRKITGASPIKPPARDVLAHIFEQEKDAVSQDDVSSAWKGWWNWRPGGEKRFLSRAQAVELACDKCKDKPGRCVSATYDEKAGGAAGAWTITWRQWKETTGGEVVKIDPTDKPLARPTTAPAPPPAGP